jgi:ADP-ribose pyrophosphatase
MTIQWKPQFVKEDALIAGEELLFSGYGQIKKLDLQFPLFKGGLSNLVSRELYHRPPAVAVLLFDPEQSKVVMVEQIRMGAFSEDNPWLLEIVAGVCDEGENRVETAYREVKEETGCTILSLLPIVHYLASPGISDEKIFIYCAQVVAPITGGVHGLAEEGEDIKVHVFSLEEVFELLSLGKIISGPAVVALQWLKLNYLSLHFPLHAE